MPSPFTNKPHNNEGSYVKIPARKWYPEKGYSLYVPGTAKLVAGKGLSLFLHCYPKRQENTAQKRTAEFFLIRFSNRRISIFDRERSLCLLWVTDPRLEGIMSLQNTKVCQIKVFKKFILLKPMLYHYLLESTGGMFRSIGSSKLFFRK